MRGPTTPESLRRFMVEVGRAVTEPASPDHFIPALPGWRERSTFIAREGTVTFRHYDLYAQALSKIERGHDQDVRDVARMLDDGLIDRAEVLRHYEEIEPLLYRFPAIDPASFRQAVDQATHG